MNPIPMDPINDLLTAIIGGIQFAVAWILSLPFSLLFLLLDRLGVDLAIGY